MPVVKDMFLVDIGSDVIDLGEMSEDEWKQVSDIAKNLIKKQLATEVSRAYIAAFLEWLETQKEFRRAFDTSFDQMN